jgi:ABC-2 type transport system ATP-binding protein
MSRHQALPSSAEAGAAVPVSSRLETVPAPARLDAPTRGAATAAATPPAHTVPLALRGVAKRWHKSQAPVLEDVDLTLDLGTRTWIGGRNGAGKTTLMRIAAGLIDPDRGQAQVWGHRAGENRRRYQRLVSFLPAGDRGLYARLSVRDQLDFWARIALLPPKQVRTRIEQTIDSFDLRELAERRVDRMSMGQRQRLRIAMTFMTDPEIVLLDEPLTSLDAEGATILDRALEELIGRGGTLLWCSPSGERLDRDFDDYWLLERGKLARV